MSKVIGMFFIGLSVLLMAYNVINWFIYLVLWTFSWYLYDKAIERDCTKRVYKLQQTINRAKETK